MVVTVEVDKEQFDNVVNKIQAKKNEVATSLSYDEKLKTDLINGRFFDGRTAVEKDYDRFCGELMDMLSKCTLNV